MHALGLRQLLDALSQVAVTVRGEVCVVDPGCALDKNRARVLDPRSGRVGEEERDLRVALGVPGLLRQADARVHVDRAGARPVVRRHRPGDRLAGVVDRRVLRRDEALEDLLDRWGQGGRHRGEYIRGMSDTKVVLTPAAADVVRRVKEAQGGRSLSLVIGNGCCDSTAPFLFADYMAGPTERLVGAEDGVQILVDDLVASSFAGREVVVDASDDPQPDSFSCESELGFRFSLERLPAV
jgi:uncharacterized protein (DUF779 family)